MGHSLKKFLSVIGLRGSRQRTVIQELSSVARRSSFHIWQSRRSPTWVSPPLLPVRLTSDSVNFPAFLQAQTIAKKRADALVRSDASRARASQLHPMPPPRFSPPFHLLTLTIQARIVANKAKAQQRLKQKCRSKPSSPSAAPPLSAFSPSADRCISNLSLKGRGVVRSKKSIACGTKTWPERLSSVLINALKIASTCFGKVTRTPIFRCPISPISVLISAFGMNFTSLASPHPASCRNSLKQQQQQQLQQQQQQFQQQQLQQ